MRMRYAWLGLLLVLVAAPAAVGEDDLTPRRRAPVPLPASPRGVANEGPIRPLTLAEALRLGLRGNLQLKAGAISPVIAASRYRAERAVFDPLLTADLDYARDEQFSNFFGQDVVTNDNFGGGAGIRQYLPTGGTVSFLYRADRLTTTNQFTTINPAWTNRAVVEGTQPLLRGAGDVVMANIRLAHNDVVGTREEQRTLREQTLLQIVVAYWDLAQAQLDLQARRKSEETAAELLRDAEARLDAQVGTPLDVAEARAGLERRRGLRINAEGIQARVQDRLRQLIFPFRPDDIGGIRYEAVDDVYMAKIPAPDHEQLERYAQIAIQTRPELRAAQAGLASRSIDVTAAANAVLPQVDLVGTVGTGGLDSAFPGSFESLATGQALSAGIGVRFSMFIGQRAARSNLRLTQWARRQAAIRYKDLENSVVLEVREGVRGVVTAQAVLETAQAQVTAAEENLRGEQALLDQGKSTPFQVLLREETLTDARLTLAIAAVAVRKSAASFWRSVGMLGDRMGVGSGR